MLTAMTTSQSLSLPVRLPRRLQLTRAPCSAGDADTGSCVGDQTKTNASLARSITGVVSLLRPRLTASTTTFINYCLVMREAHSQFRLQTALTCCSPSPFQHNKSGKLNRNTRVVLIIFLSLVPRSGANVLKCRLFFMERARFRCLLHDGVFSLSPLASPLSPFPMQRQD